MKKDSKYYNEYNDYVLKDIEPSHKSKKAVFNIIYDMTDRSGLKQAFNQIDSNIQDEIIDNWINQINMAMDV